MIHNIKQLKKIRKIAAIVLMVFFASSSGFWSAPKQAQATTNLDNANGIYTDDFTDTTGISSSSNTEIATGKLALTKSGDNYNTSGYAITTDIRVLRAARWETVSITGTFPEGTTVKLQVMDTGNTLYSDTYLPNNSVGISTFPVDLSGISVLACANNSLCNKSMAIRLKFILGTSNTAVTPEIDGLTFNWTRKQGDTTTSTLSTGPWSADFGFQKGTNHSPYSNSSIYPAFRWASERSVGNRMADRLYVLADRIFGWNSMYSSQMYALNRDTGAYIWTMPFSRGTSHAGLITQNGTYYGTDWGIDNFIAIDTNLSNTGQVKWAYNFYSGHGNGQVVLSNATGLVYTIQNNSYGPAVTLYAFNQDGTIEFTKVFNLENVDDDDRVYFAPMTVGADGTLYLVYGVEDGGMTDKGKLLAIDPADGSIEWTYATGDSEQGPLIGPDGTIYIIKSDWDEVIDIKIFAINSDGTKKWDRDFGTGKIGFWGLSLKENGNILTKNYDSSTLDEISTVDGSTVYSGNSTGLLMTDSNNGEYISTSDQTNPNLYTKGFVYYNGGHEMKWKLAYSYDPSEDYTYSYDFANVRLDERGWAYAGMTKSAYSGATEITSKEFTQLFALAPWTLSAIHDSTYYRPGNIVAFTATSSMLSTNPLFGENNQVQIVMDNSDKVTLTYSSTDSSGNSVWTGSYTLPSNTSDGTHTYSVEAGQSHVQTDVTTHFVSAPTSTSNTGITLAGTFIVDTTVPVRSNGSPSGQLVAATTTTTLRVTTNESATCKYSTMAETPYGSMIYDFTTSNGTTHTATIFGLADGQSYNYYVRCQDLNSNANSDDYPISFSVASSPSVGGGGCAGCSTPPIVPNGGFKISINGGAQTTLNRNVSLAFNVNADIKKMAISMTGDFTDAALEDYQPLRQWDLCSKLGGLIKNSACPEGVYTVYAKFYTAYGRTSDAAIASSAINLKSGTVTQKNLQQVVKRPVLVPSEPFTKPLSYRQTSADVKRLQIFLNSDPDTRLTGSGAGSPGKETNYFGQLTSLAVAKFQKKYTQDILSPWGLTRGTGFVGKATLNKINELIKK